MHIPKECLFYRWNFAVATYLGYPRIHFAGQFRADTSTTNNEFCNYRMDQPLMNDLEIDHNMDGTNYYEIVNAKVTSVHFKNGTSSLKDSFVGQDIIGNTDRVCAKLASPYEQFSSLYGLTFGIQWSTATKATAFRGEMVASVTGQSTWTPVKCYSKDYHGEYPHQNSISEASQYATIVTGIDWHDLGDSEVLAQLQNAVGEGDLAFRATMSYYTRHFVPYRVHNATYGYLIGVIGVADPSDSLHAPVERAMYSKDRPLGMKFGRDDLCYGMNLSLFDPWTHVAYFEVDAARYEVRIDISNSLPTDLSNSIRDFGKMRLGILMKSCVYLLGEESGLPYATMEDLPITSGIYAVPVHPSLMHLISTHLLVLVQVLDNREGTGVVCSESVSSSGLAQSVQILLQETLYYLRPTGAYKHSLDRLRKPEVKQTILVTKYGKPMEGLKISTKRYYPNEYEKVYVADVGIIPESWSVITDESGLATFTFHINPNVSIPKERRYYRPLCTFPGSTRTDVFLPIDGHEYLYDYCVEMTNNACHYTSDIASYLIAFSDVSFTRPYTWMKDVGQIFKLYARLAPAMKQILDLSSYEEVTLPENLIKLNFTLRLDEDDPSYMPTTRDLSPAKREMILEWLEDPIYDIWLPQTAPLKAYPLFNNAESKVKKSHFLPPRCKGSALFFHDPPHVMDGYFEGVFSTSHVYGAEVKSHNISVRPLGGDSSICTLSELKEQLQTAIEIEWATIPVYLTTLYSIVESYNSEIYHLIETVIIQEMMHMSQAANLLIALNGSPLIDDPSVIPSYPATGLPGGVLPGLTLSLGKLSLEHVYKVFMGIEIPQRSFVASPSISNEKNTVGAFYNEIKECIKYLGDDIFNASTVDLQVKWPWDTAKSVGYIVPVTNMASALEAIDLVISEGEGAGLLNPNEIGSDTLAHFYKFEEIVCQKHLEKVGNFHYAYSGLPIPFDPIGVWPMRPNPTAATVLPNTNCYHESKTFHGVYRKVLRSLQHIFNGHPDGIWKTMVLMESLKVHAKRMMWIPYNPHNLHDYTTCGPVWEYTWPQKLP